MTDSKAAERQEALSRRAAARAALGPAGIAAAAEAASRAALAMELPPVVAVYWPMGGEFDSRPLIHALHEAGHGVALPGSGPGPGMEFRLWNPGDVLTKGAYGAMEPGAAAKAAEPGLAFVPLLAFDSAGHRLGRGGGHYDRWLAGRGVPAVGLAFSGQEWPGRLPVLETDIRLSAVFTETGLRRF
jgi:5-formyltetrahydrofolate cyclo-ligase